MSRARLSDDLFLSLVEVSTVSGCVWVDSREDSTNDPGF